MKLKTLGKRAAPADDAEPQSPASAKRARFARGLASLPSQRRAEMLEHLHKLECKYPAVSQEGPGTAGTDRRATMVGWYVTVIIDCGFLFDFFHLIN